MHLLVRHTDAAPTSPARGPRPGTIGAAYRHRDFRVLWFGLLASNIGTWMQNVALPAYVDDRTNLAKWVALFGFAHLGPLLLLSIVGGRLADRFPRRQWLIFHQGVQLVLAAVLALLVSRNASLWAMLGVLMCVGVSNALSAPALQSSIPQLVDKDDLPGALSLNTVTLNGSRVVGPLIAALLMSLGATVSHILLLNATTFLFAMFALSRISLPNSDRFESRNASSLPLQRQASGLQIARSRGIVARLLTTMALFSFVSLSFISIFPSVTRMAYGIVGGSTTYKWLYALWGLGALIAGLACGTVLSRFDRRRLVVIGFRGFAACMVALGFLREATLVLPVGFLLGLFYFTALTPMSVLFQQNLRDSERARVMSLWFMSFGGMVTLGSMVAGPFIDAYGPRPLLFLSASMALGLSWWCDLIRRPAELLVEEDSGEALKPSYPATLHQNGIVAGN